MTAPRLPLSRIVFYALPGFALAMPTIPAAVFLPSMYGAELGLAAAGAALFIARTADVVTDPLIGALSDRWRFSFGRRKPWILAGALIAGYALIQLFQPPTGVTTAYVTLWSVLLYLGWTMINVPYTAWGAEMTGDYNERVRITSAREGVMLLGIFAAGTIPVWAASAGLSERSALAVISWMAVIAGGPFIALMLWRVPDPLPRHIPKHTPILSPRAWLTGLKALSDNKPFLRLLTAWLVNGLANGIPSTLFLLFLQHRLEADQTQRGVLILVYFLAAVLAIPIWSSLSKRIGKHRAWCIAMLVTCAAFVWVPLLAPGDVMAFGVVCIITGMGLGADLALPPALQADVVDFDTLRNRQERAGLFFALWSMSTKLALALAVVLTFPVLAALGFDPKGENSPTALWSLAVIYAWAPVVLKLVAIALVWAFPITAARQRLIRRRLDALAARKA
ncbi:MAG: MFS transporter [Rhodospirillaceae bacterium]|nr:MFS transporter [Rhodospirillaceae bacterium]